MDLCPTTHHSVGDFRTQRNTGLGDRVGRNVSEDVFLGICLQEPPPRKPPGEGCGHRSLGVCCQRPCSGLASDSLGKSLNLGEERGEKVKLLVYKDSGAREVKVHQWHALLVTHRVTLDRSLHHTAEFTDFLNDKS